MEGTEYSLTPASTTSSQYHLQPQHHLQQEVGRTEYDMAYHQADQQSISEDQQDEDDDDATSTSSIAFGGYGVVDESYHQQGAVYEDDQEDDDAYRKRARA